MFAAGKAHVIFPQTLEQAARWPIEPNYDVIRDA
jgi:hypothetical protein